MFYLKYLKAELLRRWGKTLSISLGLACASAIIIAIISISQALSSAQKSVLHPLKNVGTDLMLTRSVNAENLRSLDETTRSEMMSENRVFTDLSKLGNPGDSFANDIFLPGTMLTFSQNISEQFDKNLVGEFAQGLILNVTHQEGKVPKVTAEFRTGGERIQINQQLTEEQRQTIQEAMRKAEEEIRAKGLDPRGEEGRQAVREAMKNYMPSIGVEYTIPERTYTQEVGPISTDIKTENFIAAGVDLEKRGLGLILQNQIIQGDYFSGADQVIVNTTYAEKKGVKVEDKLKLGGKELTAVGIVEPKLYTQIADLYLPLPTLQKISGRTDKINILLIKSTDAQSVEDTGKSLGGLFAGATVTSSTETAEQVSGSLISVANLMTKFIGLTSLIVILAAFIIAGLLSIISVNKRVREIGTLKAIGWSNLAVVRQLFLENLVLGFLGAILGIGLGLATIFILNKYNLSLSVSVGQNIGQQFLRRFMDENQGVTAGVELKIAYDYLVILIGAAVAIVGSILAGSIASLKASKLRPQEALRSLE